MKRYTTFDEIDRDLKYLRLKSKIDLEEVKLGFLKSKEIAKKSFAPMNIIANTLGSVIKRAFILKVIDKVIGIRRVKHK